MLILNWSASLQISTPSKILRFSTHRWVVQYTSVTWPSEILTLRFQEEQNGKRSRNPSTSSGYGGFRIGGGYRSRRASEGDDGPSSKAGPGGSRRGSRHNSGSGRPYKGRHSDQGQTGDWIISGSYQEKLNVGPKEGLGRVNPSGPRKRANSACEKTVTVTKDQTKMMQSEPWSCDAEPAGTSKCA